MTIPTGRYAYTSGWSAEEKFEWLQNSIPLTDWLNSSGASLLRDLRDEGFAISDGAFYEARRQAISEAEPDSNIAGLDEDELIPLGYMESNTRFNQSRAFMYQFKVTGEPDEEGADSVRFFAVSSDEHLTTKQAISEIYGMLRGDPDYYQFIAQDIELFRVFRKD